MDSQQKKLYCCRNGEISEADLLREYRKLICFDSGPGYLAYTWGPVKQKNQLILYTLDENFKELDYQMIRTEGSDTVEDMWLDQKRNLILFVFARSIEIYNLNGDGLGSLMKASYDKQYGAVCTIEDRMYVAYERNGCACVAEYDTAGTYREQLCIGSGYEISSIEPSLETGSDLLYLYALKKGSIPICVHLSAAETAGDTEQEPRITVDIVKEEGIGNATCYMGRMQCEKLVT